MMASRISSREEVPLPRGAFYAPRKVTTGRNWAGTGLVLPFSQFTTVSVETPLGSESV